MTDAGAKIRYILLPWLAASLACAAAYWVVAWWLSVRTPSFPLDEGIVDTWLPLVLASVVSVAVLHRRLALLRDGDNARPWRNACLFLGWCTVVPATVLVQHDLATAAGGLIRVAEPAELLAHGSARRYAEVTRLCFDASRAEATSTATLDSLSRDSLDLTYTVVAPLCDPARPGTRVDGLWLGVRYSASVAAGGNPGERNVALRRFVADAIERFRDLRPGDVSFLERPRPGPARRDLEASVRRSGLAPGSAPLQVFLVHEEPFGERGGNALAWAIGTWLAFGAGLVIMLLRAPGLDPEALRAWEAGERPAPGRLWAELAAGLPRPGAAVLLLMAANVAVFAAMALAGLGFASFSTADLLAWGANGRPYLHGPGVVRLVTSLFLHDGVLHLAANLYGLLYAGLFLEPLAGRARFLAIYFAAGIGGGLASVALHAATVSVGASGAILGLYGALLTLAARRDPGITPVAGPLLGTALVFVAANLLLGTLATGVDNAVHVGGLVTGILAGALLRRA